VYEKLYRTGNLDLWDSESQREDFRLIRQLLSKFDGQRLKVLDFGCYTGQLLTSLSKSFELFGIEPNSMAAHVAAERGVKMVAAMIEAQTQSEQAYDVIIACDVIEHIPNPLELLRQLRSRLRPGGIAVVSTGDCDSWLWRITRAKFWYCHFPEHISFISPRWLRVMSSRAAFELLRVDRFNHRGGSPDLIRLSAALLFWCSRPVYQTIRRMMLGSGAQLSTPGNGATKDHILCVLRAI
jgi:SAM-dependent methyltransferase